jgi:hypothetical protein
MFDKHAILSERNISVGTHSCDGAPVVVDTIEVSLLVMAASAWVKEVRDMDAGPSHSRSGVCVYLLSGLFFSSSRKVAGVWPQAPLIL